MKLHELRPPSGAHRKRRRIGRGLGSGRGTTAGKGTKGQNARSGGGVPLYFEGGQLPLVKRLPYRRGFRNSNRVEYKAVNLHDLAAFAAGSTVDVAASWSLAACSRTTASGQGPCSPAIWTDRSPFAPTASQHPPARRLRRRAESGMPLDMLEALLNAFKIPDLRRKLLFTLGLLVVFRFIAHVPVPGVNVSRLGSLFRDQPACWHARPLLWRRDGELLDRGDGRLPVHHGVDHHAAAGAGRSPPDGYLERGRVRAEQDQPV